MTHRLLALGAGLVTIAGCGEPPLAASGADAPSAMRGAAAFEGDIEMVEGEGEEKSCCDLCFEAAQANGESPGGKVCCCSEDGGAAAPTACSFADKYPNDWPAGPGQDIIDKCITEHEHGHITDGEGTCDGVGHGEPSKWEDGDDPDTCEKNQNEQELKCLQGEKCPDTDAKCKEIVEKRIQQFKDALGCSEPTHCEGP